MASMAEVAAHLTRLEDDIDTRTAAIIAALQALRDALAAGGQTTPEVDAALARLDTEVGALDAIDTSLPPGPTGPTGP